MQISAPQPKQIFEPAIEINGFQILRVIIYFYIVVKILEILLDHFRKESVKDRLGKRFQIAYAPIIGTLTKEEIFDLQNTLKNTQMNVEVKSQTVSERKKKQTKRITIDEKRNQYYDHVDVIFEEDKSTDAIVDQNSGGNVIAEEKENLKIQETKVVEDTKERKQAVQQSLEGKDNDQQQKPLIDSNRIEETEIQQCKQNNQKLEETYSTD